MQNTQNYEFVGTAAQIIEEGIKLNGRFLDAVTIGNLAKHNLIEDAGEGNKPVRGRTPRKYKIVSKPGFEYQVS